MAKATRVHSTPRRTASKIQAKKRPAQKRPKQKSQYELYPLPFFNGKERCTWDVKPTGYYGADCETGHAYAIEFLKTCDKSYGWPSLMQSITSDMIRAGSKNGIVIGFMGVIGSALARSPVLESKDNSGTFVLPRALLRQDVDIIDDQDEHIVLTLRLLKELIRDNHRLLMALAERSIGRDGDIPTATRAGAGAEFRTLPVAALQLDSVILDDQDDHLVLTIRLPKEAIRKNLNMLMALSAACVA
jgi:hypothetical protein